MTQINFANEIFEPQLCGALFWPTEKMLIVSDLHLEKGSSFSKFKQFLPPYDTSETLLKLSKTCDDVSPETILFLGDVYHDTHSLNRMKPKDRNLWNEILEGYKIIWVEGNHDPGQAPSNIEAYEEFTHKGITFRHIANETDDQPEMSGHYHPVLKFFHKRQKLRRPCFVMNESKIILPSYGTFTGGLDITDKAFQNIVNDKTQFFVVTRKKILTMDMNKKAA
ncbi:MAG: ligase-associated DNA damage response endonuclease PdeM [Pseudomonadota bacterium]